MAKRLTTEQLKVIRKRAEEATEGPWEVVENYDSHTSYIELGRYAVIADLIEYDGDADFIAHARGDIPALLAEVERLQSNYDLLADSVSCGVSCSECSNQLAENWEIIGGAFICAECTEEMEAIRNDREEA